MLTVEIVAPVPTIPRINANIALGNGLLTENSMIAIKEDGLIPLSGSIAENKIPTAYNKKYAINVSLNKIIGKLQSSMIKNSILSINLLLKQKDSAIKLAAI